MKENKTVEYEIIDNIGIIKGINPPVNALSHSVRLGLINSLKELSDDPFFIHKPKLKSLNGITNLMDESFEDAKNYLKNPSYNTLILIPINDQIVPRKPLIEIF